MITPQVISAVPNASMTQAGSWLLTSSGVAVDTQTITIGGVVFTTVTALSVGPAVAGEVVIGASAAATITNLAAAINAPLTDSLTFTALSVPNANLITTKFGLTAVATSATVLTLTSSTIKLGGGLFMTVSETETNFAWTTSTTSAGFGPQGGGSSAQASIQLTASSVTSGNGVFTVEASNDATNWVVYARITSNLANTNGQTDTRVASVTLNSNTSLIATLPDPYAFFRVKVVVTTDGNYSATAYTV